MTWCHSSCRVFLCLAVSFHRTAYVVEMEEGIFMEEADICKSLRSDGTLHEKRQNLLERKTDNKIANLPLPSSITGLMKYEVAVPVSSLNVHSQISLLHRSGFGEELKPKQVNAKSTCWSHPEQISVCIAALTVLTVLVLLIHTYALLPKDDT